MYRTCLGIVEGYPKILPCFPEVEIWLDVGEIDPVVLVKNDQGQEEDRFLWGFTNGVSGLIIIDAEAGDLPFGEDVPPVRRGWGGDPSEKTRRR